jgi:hypothetical protein
LPQIKVIIADKQIFADAGKGAFTSDAEEERSGFVQCLCGLGEPPLVSVGTLAYMFVRIGSSGSYNKRLKTGEKWI